MSTSRRGKGRARWLAETLARDESGSITPVVLVFFVVILAIGGLAIDLGRLYGVHGQMQSYVDNASLAAATQLDGNTNAMQRAVCAATGTVNNDTTACPGGQLVSGWQNFANGTGALAVQKLTFLDKLGPDPGPRALTPATGDDVLCTASTPDFTLTCINGWTPSSANLVARFVEVRAVPRQVSYIILPIANLFGSVFGTGDLTATLGLKATGGLKKSVCDITPLMICNPDEPAGNTDTAYPYTPVKGQQILMKQGGSSGGGSASWVPGDFGLVVPDASTGGTCNGNNRGTSFISCVLALVNPLTQCTTGGVSVKPGEATATSNALNARFDIYSKSGGKFGGDPLFAPSVNATKGLVGHSAASCPSNFDPAPTGTAQTVPLPRDSNLQADTTGTVRFGNASWNAQAYWATNHPGTPYPSSALGSTPTRYSVYRYEVNNNLIPNKSAIGGENGNPSCTVPGVNNSYRDRRTLIMAVVNCHAYGDQLSGANSNNAEGVSAVAFVKMFLTEPVGLQEDSTGKVTGFNSSVDNIYGEVVDAVKPGDKSGVLHVYPVLYR